MQVTEYVADRKMAATLVDESYRTARWLTGMNVTWMLSTGTHAVRVDEKIRFPIGRVISANGGGQGLAEMLFSTAKNKSVAISYEA